MQQQKSETIVNDMEHASTMQEKWWWMERKPYGEEEQKPIETIPTSTSIHNRAERKQFVNLNSSRTCVAAAEFLDTNPKALASSNAFDDDF